MNRTVGVLKMHWRDKWGWVYVPWIILFTSFVVNLFIGLMAGDDVINSGGMASIYCYMFVVSLIVQGQTFPFALGLSVRRTDYFLGTASMGMIVCAASAILLLLLSAVENLTDAWGVKLHYFTLPFLNDVSPIGRLGIYFIVMAHMFFLGFLISSLHRRVGRNGMLVAYAALFLIVSIGSYAMTYFNKWINMFTWIGHHYMDLFIWMIPLTIIYAILSYGLLRRATVS